MSPVLAYALPRHWWPAASQRAARVDRRASRPLVARGLLVALLAVSYVAGAVGVPLPGMLFKDASVPFPCQFRSCGCQSAAQCAAGCCCFTAAQRRLWAEAHSVEYLAALDYHRPASASCCTAAADTQVDQAQDSCCRAPSSDASEPDCDGAVCCAARPCCQGRGDAERRAAAHWQAIPLGRCHGGVLLVVIVDALEPPALASAWCDAAPLDLWGEGRRLLISRADRPPSPPPRGIAIAHHC